MVASVSGGDEFVDIVDKFVHLFLGVETGEILVSLEGVIVIHLKVGHPTVVVSEKTSQNAFMGSKMFGIRAPQKLHSSVLDFPILVKSIHSSKKLGLKSEVSKQSRISARMSKSVYLPTNSRGYSKLLSEEVMTKEHVVDQVLVVRTSFVC